MARTRLSFILTTVSLLWAQTSYCGTLSRRDVPKGITPREDVLVPTQNSNVITTVMTNITANRESVSVEINVADSVAHFKAALDEDGETFDGDVEAAASRLVEWHGCNKIHKREVYRGWYQSGKIMNHMLAEVDNINWNEASAVEYLGPPGLIKPVQEKMKDIYKRWGTIQPSYFESRFDWRIHIRCDDPRQKCKDPCDPDPKKRGPWAYTTNSDPDSNLARINFCPRYFMTPSLNDAIQNGKDGLMGELWTMNVDSYLMNKAHVWAHEIMHIDWATNAKEYGENRHVSDIEAFVTTIEGEMKTTKLYGPANIKALARYPHDPGLWTIRSADSLALYATVRYIQSQLGGVYPHLPLAPAPPHTLYAPERREEELLEKISLSMLAQDVGAWDLYSNGTVGLPGLFHFQENGDRECPAADELVFLTEAPADYHWDEDAEGDDDYVVTLDKFVTAKDLGEEYTKQLTEWWSQVYGPVDSE